MKKIFLLVLSLLVLFLPLQANAQKRKSKSSVKKTTKSSVAKRADVARRRAEEARRRAAIAYGAGLRSTTFNNILQDDIEGEDMAIRKAAIDALGGNAGTVVVMETQTGKIFTIVNQDWAIKKSFPPCSTIKLVTTIAGFNSESISEDDEDSQNDLETALARSQNPYFQKLGNSIDYSKFIFTAKELGLGSRTGINALGESAGKIAYIKRTAKVFSHGYDSHGNDFQLSALQEAILVSTIANKGMKVTPFIPKKDKNGIMPTPKIEKVDLPPEVLDGVIPGMKGTAVYGTARRGVDASMGIAGKTGTCQGTGLFVSVAPIDNPKYTVVVITRGSYGRGRDAAAVAGKVYQALYPTPVKEEEIATQPEGLWP